MPLGEKVLIIIGGDDNYEGREEEKKLSYHVGLGEKFRHNSKRNILTDAKVSFFLGARTTERFTRGLFYTFLNQARWEKSLIIIRQK